MTWFEALILGLLEGVTEFLPVSSTGHLVLVSALLKLEPTSFQTSFIIAIQAGAILAVVALYGRRLLTNWNLTKRIAVAFVPTGIVGFALYKVIKTIFLTQTTLVVVALALGGVLMIVFEAWYKRRPGARRDVASLSYRDAFFLGLAQAVSVVPGVSRSGATILGGLALGLSRQAVVEFTFLLAIPTMVAATGYDLYRSAGAFTLADTQGFLIGFVFSFLSALVAIKWLMRFIANHDFTLFGAYRIAAAILMWWLLLA